MKKTVIFTFVAIIVVTMCLSAGCQSINSAVKNKKIAAEAPKEHTQGYISTEIDNPNWVNKWGACEAINDNLYIIAYLNDGSIAIADYNTVSNSWNRYDIDTSTVYNYSVDCFSATENSFWILLREQFTPEEISNKNFSRILFCYLIHFDRNTGIQTRSKIDFHKNNSAYFVSLIALDANSAVLSDIEKTYLIDESANIISFPEFQIYGSGFHARAGDDLYVETERGISRLDIHTLQYDEPLCDVNSQALYGSCNNRLFITENNLFYVFDINSGNMTQLFAWTDTSLSFQRLFGLFGLENSKGDIFHLTDRITKVTSGEIPTKKVLKLACFGDTSDAEYEYSMLTYTCSDSLTDAIIRFNNSDPEYKIEIEPIIYHDEADRSRKLIELTSNDEIDIIDTSLLPYGAIGKELLVDMLPYLDNDDIVERDNFHSGLLKAMTRNGGLYQFTDKYTLLTMITGKNLSGNLPWTTENICNLLEQNPEMQAETNRDKLVELFTYAASAEFLDWDTLQCYFEDETFISWLFLLKELAYREPAERGSPFLFNISYDFSSQAGPISRAYLKDEYAPVGFPDSASTGSYFLVMGHPDAFGSGIISEGLNMSTIGCSTSLGIMASSKSPDGAWRFIRTFMLGEVPSSLAMGIPVQKESFERAITISLNQANNNYTDIDRFTETDAENIRNLVYNSIKIVCEDDAVLEILRSFMNAYLDGHGSAEEIATQIQNRMNIYMAEQYG